MKIIRFITVVTISTALTACGSKETVSPATDTGTTVQAVETTAVEKEIEATETAALETIAELLGKSDLQAAEVFGGGRENWTEDNSFYIGRVYQVNLFDEEVSVYTSYDEKQLVNSISVWLTNGEGVTMEEYALQWEERLNEFTGAKPDFYDTTSEGGSKTWKWFLGDRAIALNWLDDTLTISMNVMVGELE